MKRFLLALVTGFVLAVLVLGVTCQREPPDTPEMTAPEVCQYVNQALPDEYIFQSKSRIRLDLRYAAQSAQYEGDGIWLAEVKVVVELQRIKEYGKQINPRLIGQGIIFRYYHFHESTAELVEITKST